ncbi:threonine aldolase family protein [Streptomyces coeruleoprunus]|uniref:Threonine aldolase family protein n=1 Tax=Streptomyces coeruleoprunus TaxID=285563 RepID=A0ABV9XGY0_9ACTN
MTGSGVLDFRSDTVTKPDDRMRAAMAAAEVGDDVLDGDPTMRALEEKAAELLGVEAALWVPSGSMGNLVALFLHLRPGDRFLAPAQAHVLESEVGTASWLAGGMAHPLPWRPDLPGAVSAEDVRAVATAAGPYFALRTTLLCVENTHNAAGGTVVPPDAYARLTDTAHELGLTVHLDGARVWHAAVALGVKPAELTRGAHTVQACLSKGLGAPVGSVVGGSAAFVDEARRVRKMLGGGVRQGGVLAAAGLVALDTVDRLADDHENARLLAEGLSALGWDVTEPQTNIVMARVPDVTGTVDRLAAAGVLTVPVGGRVRLMTHRDVSRGDVRTALERIAPLAL